MYTCNYLPFSNDLLMLHWSKRICQWTTFTNLPRSWTTFWFRRWGFRWYRCLFSLRTVCLLMLILCVDLSGFPVPLPHWCYRILGDESVGPLPTILGRAGRWPSIKRIKRWLELKFIHRWWRWWERNMALSVEWKIQGFSTEGLVNLKVYRPIYPGCGSKCIRSSRCRLGVTTPRHATVRPCQWLWMGRCPMRRNPICLSVERML